MNYTEKLIKEIERVTLRGNADKETIRHLGEIIYDLDIRMKALEAKPAVEEKAVKATKTETKEEK